jgi:hypothetical protein
MISQSVNGVTFSVLWADAFIADYSGLAGRRIESRKNVFLVCNGLAV